MQLLESWYFELFCMTRPVFVDEVTDDQSNWLKLSGAIIWGPPCDVLQVRKIYLAIHLIVILYI